MATIYFAKFNINEKINRVRDGSENLDKLLNDVFNGINQKLKVKDVENESIIYKFVNLDYISSKMTINGDIVKIYDGIDSNYDEKNDEVIDTFAKNKADYVSFSFDVKNEIIGFVPKQSFSRNSFINYFRLLVEQCVPSIGETEIILLKSKNKLENEFKKMEKMRDLEVFLIPENGDRDALKDILKDVMPEVQETNAQHLNIKLKGTLKEPLDKDSKLIKKFKSIALMAYATLKASGKNSEGDEFKIDSEKDLLLTKDIRGDNRNSLSEIEELTQKGVESYRIQKIQEVIEIERGRES